MPITLHYNGTEYHQYDAVACFMACIGWAAVILLLSLVATWIIHKVCTLFNHVAEYREQVHSVKELTATVQANQDRRLVAVEENLRLLFENSDLNPRKKK